MASGMGGSFPCLKTMPSTNPGGTVSKSEGGRGSGGGGGAEPWQSAGQHCTQSIHTYN